MTTTSQIKSSVRLAVEFKGAAPIDGGMISFASEDTGSTTVAGGAIISKRITYSDLVVDSTNRIFEITFTDGDLTDANSNNLLDRYFDLQNSMSFAYVKTNTAVAITGSIPFPSALPANGQALIDGAFTLSPAVADNGDIIVTLTWTQSALNAIGTSNFYCDLILA